MIVTNIRPRCLEVSIMSGPCLGETRLIFPITLTSKDNDYAFIVNRVQFPIRLAFAMTINKSQGQSLARVGLDLRISPFAHGQLYIAFSRSSDASQV
jgi:ATP-dependent exoDNAse (exonuclease V) alpha subunit